MASGSTPVQARPYPLESDVPDVAADLHSLALSLENVPPYSTGLLSARPAFTAVTSGTIYRATDTSQWFIATATQWFPILVGNSWTSHSLVAGLGTGPGGYVPAARIVGDKVELRGTIKNTSGGTKSTPVTICTLAAGFWPASTVTMTAQTAFGAGLWVTVSTAGVMIAVTTAGGLVNGDSLLCDGLSYSLS